MTTNTGRKVRSDAKLEQLNEAQRELLHFWFEEQWSYHEVAKLVREQFGISVGKSTLSAYYRRHVLSVQQEDEAEIVAELAALPAGDFDVATLQRAKALLWAALATINPDVDLAAKLSRIVDRAERRALAVRKIDLEERKVVVREKLAALREAKEERRRAKAGVETTRHTKRPERVGESAGTVGRSECAEVAAKAQSCEGRSEGAEGGKVESREIGKVGNGSERLSELKN